jgi:anti-sigma factor RsiW
MTCGRVLKALPLFVGRDLEEVPAREVAAHLEACLACRAVEAELHESRAWLRAAGEAPFDEADYAAVRRGAWRQIEERTQPREKGLGISALVFSGIASLCVVVGAHLVSGPRAGDPAASARKAAESLAGAAPKPVEPAAVAAVMSRLPPPRRRAAPERHRQSARATEIVKIEFRTANPDVRIIWLVKEGGIPPGRLSTSRNQEAS